MYFSLHNTELTNWPGVSVPRFLSIDYSHLFLCGTLERHFKCLIAYLATDEDGRKRPIWSNLSEMLVPMYSLNGCELNCDGDESSIQYVY